MLQDDLFFEKLDWNIILDSMVEGAVFEIEEEDDDEDAFL